MSKRTSGLFGRRPSVADGLFGPSKTPKQAPGFEPANPLNVNSEMRPGDYADYEPIQQSDTEEAEVKLVDARFTAASMQRRSVEREWVLSIAMAEGRQWLGWDDAASRAVSLMDRDEPDRYITHNLVRPLLQKVVAMATMTKPDADVKPHGDSQLDEDAASEGRLITAHLASIHRQRTQMQNVCGWAATCGVAYTSHLWDRGASADVPKFGPDGSIVGFRSLPIGEEHEDVIPPFEIYVDPVGKTWDNAGWVIHGCNKPLSWFVHNFGDLGKNVIPDAKDASGDFSTLYTTGGLGGASQLSPFGSSGGPEFNAARCLTMWEKPTPRYADGRVIIVAGTIRLWSGPWPAKYRAGGKPVFPYARMAFQEASGHPYGQGLVKDISSIQIEINRIVTRIAERMDEDKLTVVYPMGSKIDPDAYTDDIEETRHVRKIIYDALEGSAPVFQQPVPLSGDWWRYLAMCWDHMQHIAGVHDVNQGNPPAGVTAGTAIQLLQQGDQTQLSGFTAQIETYAFVRNSLQLANYAEYADSNLPRMMSLDDSGNPQTGRRRAMAFDAITRGGCSVFVVPGSATPKTPAGEQQEILDYLHAGLFGPPNTPQAAIIAVKMLGMAKSDMVLDMLAEQLAHERAMAPSPADLQAQQHAQQMEQLQQQLQTMQQTIALQNQGKMQLAGEMAALKEHIDAQAQAAKADREIELLHTKSQLDMIAGWIANVVPNVTGALDKTAMVDLEKQLGLEGKVDQPPTPGGAAGQGA